MLVFRYELHLVWWDKGDGTSTLANTHAIHPQSQGGRCCTSCSSGGGTCYCRPVAVPTSTAAAAVVLPVGSVAIGEVVRFASFVASINSLQIDHGGV